MDVIFYLMLGSLVGLFTRGEKWYFTGFVAALAYATVIVGTHVL